MSSMRPGVIVLALGLALGLGFRVTRAEEGEGRWQRRVDPRREVKLPFRELTFDPAMRVTEGPRQLGDLFPYLAAAPRAASSTSAVEVVPQTLRSFLHAVPPEEGMAPARIRSGQAAIEAVRLFLAGPVVADASTADRLIETGRGLAARLEHLEVKVTDHRPDAWAPAAQPGRPDESGGASQKWQVSLVAFELDHMLRLVHVIATVTSGGDVALERHPIVNGPMTSWQTAVVGEYTDEMKRREEAMRAEAVAARRAYAVALRPARTLDAFWAVGRVLHDMADVRAVFGEPDRDIGSGIHIWTYDLPDGSAVVFGGGADRVVYVRHVRGAHRGLKGFERIGTIYTGPAR